jgi:hypothetical protein
MTNATKRAILRWVHLVFTIPALGTIYGSVSEFEQYADASRYFFVPVVLFTGYWMYAGLWFALIGVAAWLGAFHLFGFGWALLGQVVLLLGRKVWQAIRARRSKRSS